MENATKALLIAGAVLIAIILISTGLIILRSTSGVQDQVGTISDSMAVSAFNAQFNPYLGKNIPAVQVRALLSTIKANNSKNTHHVFLTMGTDLSVRLYPETAMTKITDAYYDVTVANADNYTGYSNDGYIQIINLKKSGNTTTTIPNPPSGESRV